MLANGVYGVSQCGEDPLDWIRSRGHSLGSRVPPPQVRLVSHPTWAGEVAHQEMNTWYTVVLNKCMLNVK